MDFLGFHPGILPRRKIPAAHRGAVTAVESAGPLEAGHRMDGWMDGWRRIRGPWRIQVTSTLR